MSSKEIERRQRLMPNGVPKHIRCYDNGGLEQENGSRDRYTVIFSHADRFGFKGRTPYLCMDESPYSPGGFGMHEESKGAIDHPSSGHLGRRIQFSDLPHECQRVVLADYQAYWRL